MSVQLHIESLSHGGEAISHLDDGRVAFVEGGCPGDIVEARITAEHPRRVEAQVTKIIEPSAARTQPPCPYFGMCGGCQWQHVTYAMQLEAKQRIVSDALQRIGGIDPEGVVHDTVASPSEYGYRNKIELLATTGPKGLTLGYARAGSHDIIDIDTCLLLPGRLARAPRALRGALRYVAGGQDLALTRAALRSATNTRDVELALWTEAGPFPRAFAESTLATAVKTTGMVRVITKDRKGTRAVSNVEVLKGKGAWRERLEGRSLLVSAPSFFQVNTAVAELLVDLVIGSLEIEDHDRVLDMYSGVGTFTLPLAELADETVAIESSRFALLDLRRNAENAEVYVDIVGGDAARELSGLGRFDRAIVDPPRAGLSDTALAALADTLAQRIAYVSCDPATLARDLKRLTERDYRLISATPVDLFPQTYHVETVAVLERAR